MARTLLRRVFRGTLRAAKGLLLVLAIAALVAWPLSHRHPGRVEAVHWSVRRAVESEWAESLSWYCGWGEGRAGVCRRQDDQRNYDWNHDFRAVPMGRLGWNWRVRHGPAFWGQVSWHTSGWGPFEWDLDHEEYRSYYYDSRGLTLPCWLLALIAGAWPGGSAAMQLRRRRRLRSLARAGRCPHCGYDCRATPDRCPECGARGGRRGAG